MSIQKFTNASLLSMGLTPLDAPGLAPRAGVDFAMPGKEGVDIGVWESEPGSFERTIKEGEIMHILAGEASFTTVDGQHTEFTAGDILVFPPNTLGRWTVKSTLRKFYVIL